LAFLPSSSILTSQLSLVLPAKAALNATDHVQATWPHPGDLCAVAFRETRFIQSSSGMYLPFMQPLQVQIDAFVQERNAVSH
jgi:hypothetical protein